MQTIAHEGARVETGAVQFGDDWPGVFIRGDNAFALALPLQALLDGRDDPLARAQVGGLLSLLRSSNVHADAAIADWNTRYPTPSADEVEAVWNALKEQCCSDPVEATKCVMVGKDQLARALQARSAEPVQDRHELPAEPEGEEPVAWNKLAEIGITSWRQACEWMIELDEIHVGDGETEILEGLSAIRKALLSGPATPTNPERLVEGWRPIDSAPKDGTSVLLHAAGPDGGQVVAAWDADWNDGWWLCDDGKCAVELPLRGDAPTHWMPLPAAPLKEGE